MRISTMPGEFGWKALFMNYTSVGQELVRDGWFLSDRYYFSEEEVISESGRAKGYYKWPVEVLENGTVYVPDQSELI